MSGHAWQNLVDIGGRRLYMEAAGHGSPTVVLEAGASLPSDTWDAIWPELTAISRVARYDRANLGRSDTAPMPRTSRDVAADLHALLSRANVPGPYVLVGHSMGGLHARVYAKMHPHNIVGVVMVDCASAHHEYVSRLAALLPSPTPDESPAIRQYREFVNSPIPPHDKEGMNIHISHAQVSASDALGDRPLIVLAADHPQSGREDVPTAFRARVERLAHNLQRELARLSGRGEYVVVEGSGHFIQYDQPPAVIHAIRQVVEAARSQL